METEKEKHKETSYKNEGEIRAEEKKVREERKPWIDR